MSPSRKQDGLILIIDLESSLVRGSLMRIMPGAEPRALARHALEFAYRKDGGSDYLVKNALAGVKHIIDSLLKELHTQTPKDGFKAELKKIRKVHFVLSSPWIVSQAKSISASFPREIKVTEDRIQKLLEDQRLSSVPKSDGKIVIEEKIFDVRLNGYNVPDWHDQIAHAVEISYTVSFGSAPFINELKKSCDHIVSAKDMSFHSALILLSMGIQDTMPEHPSYVLIHPHGELTDVVSVRDRAHGLFASYPVGIDTLRRKISSHSGTMDQSTESLISLGSSDSLDASHAREIERHMHGAGRVWARRLSSILLGHLGPSLFGLPHVLVTQKQYEDFFLKQARSIHPDIRIISLPLDPINREYPSVFYALDSE